MSSFSYYVNGALQACSNGHESPERAASCIVRNVPERLRPSVEAVALLPVGEALVVGPREPHERSIVRTAA